MNCEKIQEELLGSERPERPSADVLAHLDTCSACREYQGRLVQIERNVCRVHVPGSATRDAFLLDLVLPDNPSEDTPLPPTRPVAAPVAPPGPVVRLSLATVKRPEKRSVKEMAWEWRYGLGAAAAAALLFAFAGIVYHNAHRQRTGAPPVARAAQPATDPLVASLMQRNLTLVGADKADDRADALTRMADDLGRESQALAQAPDSQELANLLTGLQGRVTDVLKQMKPNAAAPALAVVETPAVAADSRRVKQLYRNRTLIQTLVDGGIRLAAQDDSLRRADSCSDMAKGLAIEIGQAAHDREADRAAEMGQHLHDLLQRGVARNLRSVRRTVQSGSTAEMEMERVRDWVKDVAQPLEDQLRLASDTDRETMNRALNAIHSARREVENAVKG